jgi:hypothetical protein
MIGGAVTKFDASNAYLGVGDSTTAFDKTQTDLQGTNKLRKSMDSGYPDQDPLGTGDNQKVRYQATFSTEEANWTWNEWGLFNAATAGTMHNREVENIGTKTSLTTWVFQVDISLIA